MGTGNEEGNIMWDQCGGNWDSRALQEHRVKWWELERKKGV